MKLYGLREIKSGKYMGFETSSNESRDFCYDVCHTLYPLFDGDPIWLVGDRETAEKALTSTNSYNATYDTPEHNYEGKLEVVVFELSEVS